MPAEIISIFDAADYDAQVLRAQKALRDGQIVVLPTETVYGGAGLLNHPKSLEALATLRGGDRHRAFTVHLARREDAESYLDPQTLSDYARRMMKKLWPGPVAMMFEVPAPRRAAVARQLGVEEHFLYDPAGNVTLRVPDHIVTTDVFAQVPGPLAMTVAGSTPGGPGWSAAQAAAEMGENVSLILDAGPTRLSKPSTIVKVNNEGYQILRQGVYDERIIDKLMRTTILFVCSGNTCRSPMAEALARRVLARQFEVPEGELERKGINVMSAGSFAMQGARATPQAVEALREMGSDLTQHRSRPLSVEMIHQADMIFTMGRAHAAQVAALVPSAAEKVSTLDPAGDIDDPIGGDTSLYKDLAGQLQKLIEQRLQALK